MVKVIVQVAWPLALMPTLTQPETGLPFRRKVTVPVLVPDPGATGFTVALNVTGTPVPTGFELFEVSATVVEALLTTCGLPVRFPELGSKPFGTSPAYDALIA